MARKIRIAVVYGGKSGEHEVSVVTAKSVVEALDFDKYEVLPFYIAKTGEWRRGPTLSAPAPSEAWLSFGELGGCPPTARGAEAAAAIFSGEADVAFPLLHGTFGEDGTVQGMFEMAGVPYVGSGVLASAAGMDKAVMKQLFAQNGLPQCRHAAVTAVRWEREPDAVVRELEAEFGYPCFVKPANLGSSVGISKAKNAAQLREALQLAFSYDRKVVVEEFVDAREVEVGVLGNDEPAASVVGEIIPSNEFYDYEAKYVDGRSKLVIPAELPEATAEQIRELAVRAFRAIDGAGLARVDFFVRRSDGAVFVNEINTMPGFTPHSMYPLLWRATGKPYRELLDDLIRLAFERHEARGRLRYSFEPPVRARGDGGAA